MNQWVDMKLQQQSDNICTFRKTSGIEQVRVSTTLVSICGWVCG